MQLMLFPEKNNMVELDVYKALQQFRVYFSHHFQSGMKGRRGRQSLYII